MKVHDVPQRSVEWFQLRLGLLTGSCAAAVIAERKRGTGELKERATLRRRLVCERLTSLSAESTFQSEEMKRGADMESAAFAAYEARTRQIVQRVGFVTHDTLAAGCSPDGYIGNWEGVLELKCPKQTTHYEYMQAGVVPDEYRGQVVHALWVTGAQWLDFCSFDPRFPASLELFIVRYPRIELEMAAYGSTVEKFLSDCDAEVAAMQARSAA